MNTVDLLQLDAASRERALALASFLVEAPAGAGKTELLTQRYLSLLGVVEAPEEIIAITFTNKAAAEMRNRILDGLESAVLGTSPEQPHKRITFDLAVAAMRRSEALGWRLLEEPGRLRITTIDAFSSLLARQMPLLSRFGGQPGVSEDARLYYREAARRTLCMLEDEGGDGPVTTALSHFDNDSERLVELLSAMLARRDQWLHHVGRVTTREEVETALRRLVEHDIARAAQVLTTELQAKLMPIARYAAANLPNTHPLASLRDWDAPLPSTAAALPLWRSVCELLLTAEGNLRRRVDNRLGFPNTDAGRAYKEELLNILASPLDVQPLACLRTLPELSQAAASGQIIENLAHLLQLATAHLWLVFQEAGEVDFIELSSRALAALEDAASPTDLALALDCRIRHLLVDEFQDTSPAQVELLRRLTLGWETGDGRTLFCVGDPMQSIYRFRKADVGLFLQAARFGIGRLRLERLQLTRNNRSCPPVVEWVNQVFASVFPPQDSATRGAICYRPFVASRADEAMAGVFVHALVLTGGEAAALAQEEARYVADLIEQERARYPGRNIAVLVRARAHLKELVGEIRRQHPCLRFLAVEVEQLAGRQAVQDALLLTRALLHRADRVNWLALLRAPWCGLRLADLYALAADNHTATIWQLMQDEARLSRLSEDGRQRLLHVRSIIAQAYAHQGRQPLRRWLEGVWLQLGGAHCLWDAGDVRDVEAFFGLVEHLHKVGEFSLDQLELAMAELYAAPDVQADGTLQFMTIHKSKGLEFDTVILPGLSRQPRQADAPLLLWEEVAIDNANAELIAAPLLPAYRQPNATPTVYAYLQKLEQERSANEEARMLYVAATRSKHRLHLVGTLALNGKGELKPPKGSFVELLWGTLEEEFRQATPREPAPPPDAASFVPKLVRLLKPKVPELLRMAPPMMPLKSVAAEVLAPVATTKLEADCGILAHRYLEMIARDGLAAWNMPRLPSLLPAMQRWFQQQGHAAEVAGQGASFVAQILATTLQSADGLWVLRTRDDATSELTLAMAEGSDSAEVYRIDRTFVEHDVRWIIDYKSDRVSASVSNAELRALAERYRPQLMRYAQLFVREGRPVRIAVLFLTCGRLVELN